MNTEIIITRFVSIETVKDRYDSCPGMYKYYSSSKREIERAYAQWRDDIEFYKERKPVADEYELQINAIKEILHYIDKDMNPDRFIKSGSVDTAFCDIYLKRMRRNFWPEDIKDMKCLFFALQWLLQQKAEDCPDMCSAEKEMEDAARVELTDGEDEELLEILNEFKIRVYSSLVNLDGVECPDKFLFAAIMYMYQEEKKSWAFNASVFSEKIVNILPETKLLPKDQKDKARKTIYRRIIRSLKEEMGYLSPKDLTIENVIKKTGFDKEKASKIIEKFEKANIAVRGCLETIRREKQGDKQVTAG